MPLVVGNISLNETPPEAPARKKRLAAPERFIVYIRLPEGVSARDMRDFIEQAVNEWSGQLQPPNYEQGEAGDPRWWIGRDEFGANVRRQLAKRPPAKPKIKRAKVVKLARKHKR